MRAIRGAEIALIFQEPMSSFSPVHTIGNQIIEVDPAAPGHRQEGGARRGRIELLRDVGIPQPARRVDAYSVAAFAAACASAS